jgi:membrane fusion protein (multidrug efflux system)
MTIQTLTRQTPQIVGATFALLVVSTAPAWWVHSRHFESTDDAQVDGHLHAINARVSGTVARIAANAENNHFVAAGTLLVELDPTDAEAAVAQARAALNTKRAAADAAALQVPIVKATAFNQLDLARASESESEESIAIAEANLAAAQHRVARDQLEAARAERDRARYAMLLAEQEISQSDYDARATDAAAALKTVEADRAAVTAAERAIVQARRRLAQKQAEVATARTAPQQLSDAQARLASAIAQVDQAQADLRIAELNLTYMKILAPVSGRVGRKTVEIGHRIQPGQALMLIVPVDDVWVTANFKETQLKDMRPGQRATIDVDAYGGREYHGKVDSIAGATGARFSLLPPENATGNFVKVVQRVPVKIVLDPGQDPEHLLRPGMSVTPTVYTR